MIVSWAAVLVFCLCASGAADGARILGIFPYPSRSHAILGSALFRELASRGHEVTMISPFPLKDPPARYVDVELDGLQQMRDRNLKDFMNPNCSFIAKFGHIFELMRIMNEAVLEHANLQEFLRAKPKFDVAIHMWALNEALLGIADAVNATPIAFSVIGGSAVLNHQFGNPSPYAYVPHIATTFRDSMTFWQRVGNTLVGVIADVVNHWLMLPYQSRVLAKHFPNAPSLQTLMDRVDLALVNSHFMTETPRPYLPNSVQIGGFHLHEKQLLTEELQQYLDRSKHGVILFSFGTNVKSANLSPAVLESILNAFSKTKFDVLWKFEAELKDAPKNVKIAQWVPQKAVLAHPKIKAFITHGGFGSITEAVFHGVPMIAVPFFGDQEKNVAEVVMNGYAIQLQLKDVTEASLAEAIHEITTNSTYKRRIAAASDIIKNQPMNPMEKAIFWVEHVIKHQGAKHLKSKGPKLSWIQYMLVDVFAAILAILVASFLAVRFTLRVIIRRCGKIKIE